MNIEINFDMDGVTAEYPKEFSMENAMQEGYWLSRPVNKKMINVINTLIERGWSVSICSKLTPGKFCRKEKKEWITENGINTQNNIFVPPTRRKSSFVMKDPNIIYVLIDDYTKNLESWENAGGIGIKFYNGINGTHGTWSGRSIDGNKSVEEIVEDIENILYSLNKKEA